jgi:hypothetical protein
MFCQARAARRAARDIPSRLIRNLMKMEKSSFGSVIIKFQEADLSGGPFELFESELLETVWNVDRRERDVVERLLG